MINYIYFFIRRFKLSLLLTASFIIVNFNIVNASDLIIIPEIDTMNGSFRDLSWGKHISDCEDMVYLTHKQSTGGNVKIYKRTNEKLLLDNKIKLSKIEYGFLNSKLLFISMITSDPDNSKILREIVISRFGQNDDNSGSANLFWEVQDTSVILQSQSGASQSVLMLVSKRGLSSNFSK